jgi:hypothetical protein
MLILMSVLRKFTSDLFELQAIYYIPSTQQQAPKGKLYWRVSTQLAKHRRMSGNRLIWHSHSVLQTATSASFPHSLEDGQ